MISLGAYEYNPADVLGNGAFAIVYKGRVRNNPDEPVAIKIMLKDQNVLKSKTLLSKEICVLKDLNHENIVRLYDHSISSSGVYLVMEYCNGGDLSEYLQAKRTLPEDTIRHFLIQIGSAMDAMNRKGFMHRDLKPGNILLSHCRDCGHHVTSIPGYLLSFKLADFGFARFLQDGMMAVTMCGSPMYMAPEVLMCRKYDAVADIWSMGIIVYQCLTGKAPFYANTPEALKNIYEKTACLRPKIPVTTSKALQDLLLKMLIRKPSDRIDFPGSGPESSATRSSIAPALPSRNRPTVRGPGITVLGQGTGEGPYYLAPQDGNRARDKTPQGKASNNPPGSSNGPREWTNPTHWSNNTNNKQQPLSGATSSSPSSQQPTGDFNPFYPQHTGAGIIPFNNYDDPGYSLDDIDDEMTKTTVDEYIEDELDASGSSPSSDQNNLPKLPSVKPRDCMHIDSNKYPTDNHQIDVNTNFYSSNHQQQYISNNYRPSVPTRQDGFNVDEQRSTAYRFDQRGVSHMSNVGRIVRNPGAYLTNNNNNLQRRGMTDIGPLPDVTIGTNTTDTRYYQLINDNHCNNSPTLLNTNEISHGVNNKLADQYFHQVEDISHGTQVNEGNLSSLPHHNTEPKISYMEPVMSNLNVSKTGTTLQQINFQANNRQFVHPSGLQTIAVQGVDGVYPVIATGRNFENDLTSGGLWEAAEFSDEILMESEHNEEIKKITMVLELCELLAELAERRASALADCTPTRVVNTDNDDSTTTTTDPSAVNDGVSLVKLNNQQTKCSSNTNSLDNNHCGVGSYGNSDEHDTSKNCQQASSTALKFVSEAQRIVEQIVLYRRVLYYLEYVFDQVKKAFQNGRLKSTPTARRPGITLIHGLCQHAKSQRDKTLLSDCMRLLRERYACLWSTATKPNLQTMHYQPDTTMPTTTTATTTQCSNNNPTNILPSDSLPNPSLNDPSSEVNNKFAVTVGALPMTNCAPTTSPLR
ncbi:protein kinase [Schistosoma mansoni]|uniref:protein kinase n=1 Tax=Schistosoma mansoni TaxID=6183 RepID=UPI0001A61F49|nr:protein kinase [Schistosoma mansoni]|eukprot:XP_018650324.1 protein kinase [Schistosoma mansoni]